MTPPLEAVHASDARHAAADALVVKAWADHHDELFGFLVRATRDPEVAADLLQEAYLRLTREVRDRRTPDNVRAWLYRVAANLAVSRGRRISTAFRGLVKLNSAAGPAWTDDAPEKTYLQREAQSELARALDDLGHAARTALLMSSEGFSGAEIAAAIGRTELATRTLLSRTRVRLRARLETSEDVR